jgi:NADH:ubiquinone oxidoreductase subunit E
MYLKRYPDTPQGRQSAIMPALWVAQQQMDEAHKTIKAKPSHEGAFTFDSPQGSGGWVPLAAMHAIADKIGCPRMAVYEVATFFTMYNRNKQGKFHIQLCATTPCMVCGAYDIMAAIEKHLGIKCGETSADGMFTMTEVECLGACVNAPMVQVCAALAPRYGTPRMCVCGQRHAAQPRCCCARHALVERGCALP